MEKSQRLRVAVETRNEGVTIHCGCGWGDYDTLCGVDADDPHDHVGTLGTVPVAPNAKIDCPACKAIVEYARKYRMSDFK